MSSLVLLCWTESSKFSPTFLLQNILEFICFSPLPYQPPEIRWKSSKHLGKQHSILTTATQWLSPYTVFLTHTSENSRLATLTRWDIEVLRGQELHYIHTSRSGSPGLVTFQTAPQLLLPQAGVHELLSQTLQLELGEVVPVLPCNHLIPLSLASHAVLLLLTQFPVVSLDCHWKQHSLIVENWDLKSDCRAWNPSSAT